MCHLDIQSLAQWLPALSLRPVATSRTHEVSVLIQFSSAFTFPAQLNIWISCFLVFRSRSLKLFTSQYPWISVTSYFQTSSKDILLSVSRPPFSCSPCLEYRCPRALILLRLWRYINHVLTYLLTYLLTNVTQKSMKSRIDKKSVINRKTNEEESK